jgi:hypothetical protein
MLALTLVGCVVVPPSSGPQAPPQVDRRVQIPQPQNNYESAHLQQVVNVLRQSGFDPVPYSANHRLYFTIETGPVNADATIRLYREGQVVVDAFGRDGGPLIIVDRARVVRNAVDRALAEFDSQLRRLPDWSRPTPYGSYPGY